MKRSIISITTLLILLATSIPFRVTASSVIPPAHALATRQMPQRADADGFIGDKLSPDLRAAAGKGGRARVDIILQADDIDSTDLKDLFKRSGTIIVDRAPSFGILHVKTAIKLGKTLVVLSLKD